jgi:hypothetical protein
LEEKRIYANPSKSSFRVQEVEYLGHVVSHEGVKVAPYKIKAVREWSIPKTLKKHRRFLGLIGYYCNFVDNYGQIAAPLTTLSKNEAFSWTEEATKYFEKCKDVICTTLILATPNFSKTFIVECDASSHGIGAVLMQEVRPLSFERNQLKGKNLVKPIYEKKCWPYYTQFRNDDLT